MSSWFVSLYKEFETKIVEKMKKRVMVADTDTGKEQGRFSKGISGIGKKRTTDGSYGRRDAFAGSKEL